MKNKKSSAVKTVIFMMAVTVFSKVLGMLRGILLASAYGTGMEATAFSTASRIPLSFFDILFGSAILGCFIPVYNSLIVYKKAENGEGSTADHENADRFACVFFNFVLLATGILCILGIIFSDTLIFLIASELDGSSFALASRLLKIMLPMIALAGSSYTLVGILQSKGNFIVPAIISAVSNLCVILYFLLFDGFFGITGLAVAYLLSWFVQFLTLAVPLFKMGFKFRAVFDPRTPGFFRSLKMAPKVMAGSWLIPFSVLIGLDFALKTGVEGAVPAFEYANTLFTMAAGILTHSICNYVFPSLSDKASHNEVTSFAKDASKALFTVVALVIPAACALFILSPNVISVMYMRGEFDVYSCDTVSSVFTALIPGMISFSVIEVMSRCFYALGNGTLPAIASLIGIGVNYISAYLFVEAGNLPVFSVGLSVALAFTFSAVFLIISGAVRIKGLFSLNQIPDLIKLIVSALLSSVIMTVVLKLLNISYSSDGFVLNFICCAVTFISGMVSYIVFSLILHEKLISELFSGVFHKLKS
ncbi:MAG: murein biosynthesis integral membrane protein MurJ [Ruminococcaceae bacterium]|nr:murein biosynthesis integral membrane protein MurJ [Oscillospiraceae bacterium]